MTELANYGVLGIIVIALAGYIISIEKRHRDERSDWQRSNERQMDEQNRNIRENTSILSSLKTLLENRK
jgi:hypothetical protein